jgi:hypothetical protein
MANGPWARPLDPRRPAGPVYIGDDLKSLTIIRTTIERVAKHRDFFRAEIVSKIATEGDEFRKRAIEAGRQADEERQRRRAGRVRRENLAAGIIFDLDTLAAGHSSSSSSTGPIRGYVPSGYTLICP